MYVCSLGVASFPGLPAERKEKQGRPGMAQSRDDISRYGFMLHCTLPTLVPLILLPSEVRLTSGVEVFFLCFRLD